MIFNGANIDENVSIFASGERAIFFRKQGNITMDMSRELLLLPLARRGR